ncbi:hypothetical protein WJX72_004067 [[Myrmecia] bisecta]|uniref:Uncharacterized protein n=1 Tax=[Myrmecia] bisecta TaxID=41462 RepID=A0AAW1P843_9CHLO
MAVEQAVEARLDLLRQQLKASRESEPSRRWAVLKESGLLLTYAPLPEYNPPGTLSQAAANVYVPDSALEEASLCLLLSSEASPQEFAANRALCWHLCLALGLGRQHRYLAHALSKASLSQRTHPLEWRTQAQALVAAGEAPRASLCLRALLEEQSRDPVTLLLSVKASLQVGGDALKDAVQFARQAVSATEGSSSVMRAKAHVALGVALGSAAGAAFALPQTDRAAYLEEALVVLQAAVDMDPGDANALYNLALLQAEARQLPAALRSCRAALAASAGTHAASWALLALVLSAQQRIPMALAVADAGLAEAGPLYESLLLKIKARLHVAAGEPAVALRSLAHLMARVQRALTSEDKQREERRQALRKQESDLWLELARTFLAQQQTEDARFCVRQAKNLMPWSPAAHHMEGRVAQEDGNMDQAIQYYETALAVNLYYAKSALFLGRLYRKRGGPYDLTLAQAHLADGLRYEPHRHLGWYNLGMVYKAQQRHDDAERCLRTSVGLVLTAPVMSFNKLPRIL